MAAEEITAKERAEIIDGKLYVAAPVGSGGWLEGIIPGMPGAGHGSALIAFALSR